MKSDGHIRVVGRGLLLANGNGIGTNGGASVHATLFCGAADATATPFDSPAVALEAEHSVTVRFHPMRQVGRRLHPARSHKPARFWPTKDLPQL